MDKPTAPSLVERLRKVAEFIDGLVRLEQPAFDQPPEPASKEDYDLSCAVGELNDIAAALTAAPAPEDAPLPTQAWCFDMEKAPRMKPLLLFAVTDVSEDGRIRNWKMATGFYHSGFADTRGHDCSPWNWDGRQLKKYETQPTAWMLLPAPPTPAREG